MKKVTPQKSESSLEREVILDALCELGDGTLCNIEMQKSNSNDDIKRVRFHASILTVNHTPKNTKFSDIPNIKILYITEYDALGNGQAVTHISRCQMTADMYRPINDGEDIVFANARSDEENKYTHLLKLFLQKESFDDKIPSLTVNMRQSSHKACVHGLCGCLLVCIDMYYIFGFVLFIFFVFEIIPRMEAFDINSKSVLKPNVL